MKRLISSAILTAMLCGCSSTPLPEKLPEEKIRLAAIKKYIAQQGKVESIEKVKVNNVDLLLIRYVLNPTPHSYIRCGVALPMVEVWSGRFIGIGNTGFPENYPGNFYNWVQLTGSTGFTQQLAGNNNVVAITDMGFSRHRNKNPEVWKDFGFRSTHLMTVTAKEIIKLYYGRKSDYNYFFGLSTGGGQGLHEAQKFPEDYDGIISVVPASTRLYFLANNLHVYRTLHDENGKKLFNAKHLNTIRKAAVRYFADKSPAYAAGKFIADPRYTPEAAREVARIAAELDKTITPDMVKRIEKLFGPVYIGKRYAGNSVPMGGTNLHSIGASRLAMLDMFFGTEYDVSKCDIDKDLEDVFKVMSPIFNAENPDLSAFRKRGGKLIVYSGTEDGIVPYFPMLDYYQRASAAAGGVDELKENFLYYILPGRSHVSGSGIKTLKNIDNIMFDWVEKGVKPDVLTGVTSRGAEYPVPPYPLMTVGDKKSGFKFVPYPEIKTPKRDELFTASMSAQEAQKECDNPDQTIKYPNVEPRLWNGFKHYAFTFEGRKCFITAPDKPAPGMPWLWCLQWPTAFTSRTPAFQLLKKGYHYVYIDLHDTRMNPEGIQIARRFYDMLQGLSFAPKAALSGLSIGGLYALRWAAEYPETVSAIYLDAPVTTIYSSNPASLKVYEKTYALKGKELLKSKYSPNNSCKVIAKAGIPVIAIRHGEDQTVPNKTNFDVFAKNFQAAGGKLTVINHKFYGHHPHGLDDPKKLTDFILKHAE